jgi:hypothetical protein
VDQQWTSSGPAVDQDYFFGGAKKMAACNIPKSLRIFLVTYGVKPFTKIHFKNAKLTAGPVLVHE